MIRYPNLETVVGALKSLGFHVRDLGLLDSAIARSQTRLFGKDTYPTINLKAAAMVQSLISNHPMIDGNKRSSWVLLNYFLVLNGRAISATQDESFEFIMAIAEKKVELQEIAGWLDDHVVDLTPQSP